MAAILYYVGRGAQMLGMWLLLVDVAMAGPMGPDAKLFGVGVAVFLAGWGLVTDDVSTNSEALRSLDHRNASTATGDSVSSLASCVEGELAMDPF